MKKIIVINGKGEAGKDTLCEIASKYFKVTNISSIDPIKSIAVSFGWNEEKDMKSRKFLSDLKQISVNYNDMPNTYLLDRVKNFLKNENMEILFVHIREGSEIDKFKKNIKKHYNVFCKTMLIKRDDIEKVFDNSSDDNVENYRYDYVFHNNESLDITGPKFISYLQQIVEEPDEEIIEIETPLGILSAKLFHDKHYPGIKIDLLRPDKDDSLLSLVEYNSETDSLRNICWDIDETKDDPISIITFEKGD